MKITHNTLTWIKQVHTSAECRDDLWCFLKIIIEMEWLSCELHIIVHHIQLCILLTSPYVIQNCVETLKQYLRRAFQHWHIHQTPTPTKTVWNHCSFTVNIMLKLSIPEMCIIAGEITFDDQDTSHVKL